MTKYINLRIPEEEFNNLFKILKKYCYPKLDNGEIFYPKDFYQYQEAHEAYMKQEREKMPREFIKRFCNDHNEKIRWLRNVSLTMETLLDDILRFFEDQLRKE